MRYSDAGLPTPQGSEILTKFALNCSKSSKCVSISVVTTCIQSTKVIIFYELQVLITLFF